MKRLAIACVAVAAWTATASVSQAADGCGRGFYWNGHRCAPMRAYGPVYRDYGPRHYAPRGPNCYGAGCCPPHYTIQDGVCKPYRGY